MPDLGQSATSPTIHSALIEQAAANAHAHLLKLVDDQIANMRERIAVELSDAFQHVYAAGLRDGFVQGVTADTETTSPLVTENVVIAAANAMHDAYLPDEGDDLEVVWVDAMRQDATWAHVAIDPETQEPRLLTDAELEEAADIGLCLDRCWIQPGPPETEPPSRGLSAGSDA